MSDPALELQGAMVAALKAQNICGGRVYDRVPPAPQFPYLTIGTGETVNDDNSCFDGSEVNATVHVWSRDVGWPEAKGIAASIRTILKAEFALSGFTVVEADHLITRWLNDPDGITRHAVIEFRYLVAHDL